MSDRQPLSDEHLQAEVFAMMRKYGSFTWFNDDDLKGLIVLWTEPYVRAVSERDATIDALRTELTQWTETYARASAKLGEQELMIESQRRELAELRKPFSEDDLQQRIVSAYRACNDLGLLDVCSELSAIQSHTNRLQRELHRLSKPMFTDEQVRSIFIDKPCVIAFFSSEAIRVIQGLWAQLEELRKPVAVTQVPPPGFISVDELLSPYESDPELKQLIEEARRKIDQAFYPAKFSNPVAVGPDATVEGIRHQFMHCERADGTYFRAPRWVDIEALLSAYDALAQDCYRYANAHTILMRERDLAIENHRTVVLKYETLMEERDGLREQLTVLTRTREQEQAYDSICYELQQAKERERQLREALRRIDAINDNPATFDSQINEVVSAAIAQPQVSDMEAKRTPEVQLQLTGYQVNMLHDFTDGDTEFPVCLADLPERVCNTGERMPAGIYAWSVDYPEEGVVLLPETPAALPDGEKPHREQKDPEDRPALRPSEIGMHWESGNG